MPPSRGEWGMVTLCICKLIVKPYNLTEVGEYNNITLRKWECGIGMSHVKRMFYVHCRGTLRYDGICLKVVRLVRELLNRETRTYEVRVQVAKTMQDPM